MTSEPSEGRTTRKGKVGRPIKRYRSILNSIQSVATCVEKIRQQIHLSMYL
jgi:predicted transcriptional regulator